MWESCKRWLLGDGVQTGLPSRVQARVEEQQAQSERLIGWFQFAIVCTFGALYAVAPKTFDVDAMFAPVPWALAAYLFFTITRLVLSYRTRLPGWFLGLSVVVDMALLMGLIWSFHLQYGQPAAFYLKAPTMLYVFIFIALRSLRFEARYVILAGVAAALGWLLLVGYAIYDEGGMGVITRDYVAYMTSALVLLGAEFDKVISILVVTLILAATIQRARNLLVRSVVDSAAKSQLARFFAPEIATRIAESEQDIAPGQGVAREAAIMMVDIRAFTIMAEKMGATELIGLLAEYQARMVPAIQGESGAIDKFLGDGIMATFGAALPSETFAAHALRAADAVTAAAERWNAERVAEGLDPIPIGLGVDCGPVVFGAVGDGSRLEFTVIGNAVNTAAKLEKQARIEGVRALVTAEAYATARAQGYRPAREHRVLHTRPVAGFDHPLDLVVLAE